MKTLEGHMKWNAFGKHKVDAQVYNNQTHIGNYTYQMIQASSKHQTKHDNMEVSMLDLLHS